MQHVIVSRNGRRGALRELYFSAASLPKRESLCTLPPHVHLARCTSTVEFCLPHLLLRLDVVTFSKINWTLRSASHATSPFRRRFTSGYDVYPLKTSWDKPLPILSSGGHAP